MIHESKEFSRRIVRHIAMLERLRRRFLDHLLACHDLSGSMFLVLLFLDRHPGTRQDKLCDDLLIDKSGVTRKCRRLEESGYISREMQDDDKRQYKLFLTTEGERLIPIIRGALSRWRDQVTRGMSETEQQELLRLLEQMETNALTSGGELR